MADIILKTGDTFVSNGVTHIKNSSIPEQIKSSLRYLPYSPVTAEKRVRAPLLEDPSVYEVVDGYPKRFFIENYKVNPDMSLPLGTSNHHIEALHRVLEIFASEDKKWLNADYFPEYMKIVRKYSRVKKVDRVDIRLIISTVTQKQLLVNSLTSVDLNQLSLRKQIYGLIYRKFSVKSIHDLLQIALPVVLSLVMRTDIDEIISKTKKA